MTSMAAEVVAPKVFEDLPHWDEDATWDDEMTVEKVVWDAELPLDFDLQGLLQLLAHGVGDEMQCEQSDVDVPVLFKCDGSRNVFDEVLSGVVWDEEAPSTEPVGNDEDVEMEEAPAAGGLLSANADYGDENVKLGEAGMEPLDIKIVVGEDRVDADQKQVPMQASVVWDIAVQELFDGRPAPEVIWDEEVLEQDTHNLEMQTHQPNSQSGTIDKIENEVHNNPNGC
jgi:hypothetical protein